MSKNRQGFTRQSHPQEWGAKARKREDAQRSLNNTARRDAILTEIEQMDADVPVEWLELAS